MFKLHGYQQKLIDETKERLMNGAKSVLIVSPAGSGKSIVISEIARLTVNKGGQILFFVHRKELIEQIKKSFNTAGVDLSHCTVMTVGKVAHKLGEIPKPTLIICDESHHSLAKTYKKIYDYYSDVPKLGFTASPWRLSGKGLGDVYESMVEGPTVEWLIDNHFLAPYKYKSITLIDPKKLKKSSSGDYSNKSIEDSMGTASIFGDVVKNYRKFADGQQAIVYAHSIEFSKQVAEKFNMNGILAEHVDSNTPKAQRETIMGDFKSGKIKIICNVDLISEGFNVPDCGVVILMRPTKSLVIDIQQSMRGMRYKPGKVSTIIDMVGNYLEFGVPDTDREWSLDDWKNQSEVKISVCEFCFATFETKEWIKVVDENGSARRKCPFCGKLSLLNVRDAPKEKEIDTSAELVDINKKQVEQMKFANRNPYKSKSITNIFKILKSQKDLGTREIRYPLQRTLHIRMDQLHGRIPMNELEKLSDVSGTPMNSLNRTYHAAFDKHEFKNERDGITIRF